MSMGIKPLPEPMLTYQIVLSRPIPKEVMINLSRNTCFEITISTLLPHHPRANELNLTKFPEIRRRDKAKKLDELFYWSFWEWNPRIQIIIFPVGSCQEFNKSSHDLSQCCPRFITPRGITRSQCVKTAIESKLPVVILVLLTHWGLVTPNGDIELGQHWHKAITWICVDLVSVRSSDIHHGVFSREIRQPWITQISSKIIYLRFDWKLPGDSFQLI